MAQHKWLAKHPYLQPLASLHAQVESILDGIMTTSPCFPAWDRYLDDFCAGVPLLHSAKAAIDLKPAEALLVQFIERLASVPLQEPLLEQIRTLDTELRHSANASDRVTAWLLHDGECASSYPGLLRYLGWTVLSRHLRSITEAFSHWRTEDHWLRSYCPACGSLPAMAQLAGNDPVRRRLLSCGCCGTRWLYPRMGCPFCEKQNSHRLAALTVEGDPDLRIDYCESCRGYLKTYDGAGNESVMLADWTSIHLDLVAQDRGLNRLGASLYTL